MYGLPSFQSVSISSFPVSNRAKSDRDQNKKDDRKSYNPGSEMKMFVTVLPHRGPFLNGIIFL